MSTFAEFRDLHHQAEPLLLPNAWDHGSAAALAAAGFPAVGTTSLGVAAAHGIPDGEGRTREQTVALARLLAPVPCLVTVDVEGGFSDDPAEVAELAAVLVAAGAVGINLEDGRAGDRLADPGAQAETIAAIKERVPELFVNARVDTYWLGLDSADPGPTLARAGRYQDAGADGIFVPGALPDLPALVDGIGLPLNVLYVAGGPSVLELGRLGVRRVSTGSLLYRAALGSAVAAATAVRDGSEPAGPVPGYAEVQRLIG
ncbi:isocitrate lyase/PEP mutase family protein [Prauserella cavernicola]|uniref:Isocitrate lyase/phosphoenolpyruvate mutase family protein n=1 Tax=Prauserella cavernicola TaxID=2800127 RepID=A0A934QS96_9PSEU|nr:isocitrate lyase/phosphoenolpyruvate mutase family protein [Prauserella cavernicola]MBK1785400.1 isocitrate lyase/phosphoenolpyruvate mutase family protein [Prauserella cavernicola]